MYILEQFTFFSYTIYTFELINLHFFMNQSLLDQSKKLLEMEKLRLEKLLSTVGHKDERKDAEEFSADFKNIGDDEASSITEVETYEVNIGEGRALDPKLQKVNAALERIAAGTYGTCLVGGELIEEARLKAVPEAETCIKHSM